MTDSVLSSLDYHTAGEPLRIITAGLPEIPGDTMLDKRRYMAAELDHYRRLLMLEPRGHSDMYGAVLTESVSPEGDVGVLFLHNEGYSTMCGHGIIALVTAGLERGLFNVADHQAIRIDSPAGRITARAELNANGKVASVTFLNVDSFVLEPGFQLEFDGRSLEVDIAFGGAFYAYVDARALGFELSPAEAPRLIEAGRSIKQAVARSCPVHHPLGDRELGFLYGTIFVRHGPSISHSRNVCVFADGELDRSPTGTGVSGRAAIHYSRGEVGLGEPLEIESIIGTRFSVRCVGESSVGDFPAVLTEVTGSAHIIGEHRFHLDASDPLPNGFLLR
jgi:trans-L-3-hydroxyproline dehydratase